MKGVVVKTAALVNQSAASLASISACQRSNSERCSDGAAAAPPSPSSFAAAVAALPFSSLAACRACSLALLARESLRRKKDASAQKGAEAGSAVDTHSLLRPARPFA